MVTPTLIDDEDTRHRKESYKMATFNFDTLYYATTAESVG